MTALTNSAYKESQTAWLEANISGNRLHCDQAYFDKFLERQT